MEVSIKARDAWSLLAILLPTASQPLYFKTHLSLFTTINGGLFQFSDATAQRRSLILKFKSPTWNVGVTLI